MFCEVRKKTAEHGGLTRLVFEERGQEILGAFDGVLEVAKELEIVAVPWVPMRILLQRIPGA